MNSRAAAVMGPPSASDDREHSTCVVMGAGLSGMATAIQLKRKFGLDDVLVYEKTDDLGGTWNRYPGAACDVPISFYSFSFYPAYHLKSDWASRERIQEYLHEVRDKFELCNIVYRTVVEEARFSRDDGLWHLRVRNLETDEVRSRTCNILFACLGGLAIPQDPPFDPKSFKGDVFHSARYPKIYDLAGKDVVVVGNGCSAAQIVPAICHTAKSVKQVARSRQAFLPRPPIPDHPFLRTLISYVIGLGWLFRSAIFWFAERQFVLSDITEGAKKRSELKQVITKYAQSTAPQRYWPVLEPDHEVSAKRRVFDMGYIQSLNEPNVELFSDDAVVKAEGTTVFTEKGHELRADVVILATGFKVRDYMFPLKLYNSEGESLQDRMKETGSKVFQGTCVSSFPNFFWLMGPNTTTGHSSVIFTSECQLSLAFHMIRPVVAALRSDSQPISSRSTRKAAAPFVEVTRKAEDERYARLRKEMRNKTWETNGGVSWYTDKQSGPVPVVASPLLAQVYLPGLQ
ncbi:hypothetical protein BMF94_0722 [Rhodotorula taiwanensis]|uniref:Uncharacterized protein n=1 Tax=Rhodotorula taiwanensis TaxID=741276 RepID=A0A2S5BHG4_9BASI|nr:hypothetical protein BMF94_0722 [Rhodotorula taiwanensis]